MKYKNRHSRFLRSCLSPHETYIQRNYVSQALQLTGRLSYRISDRPFTNPPMASTPMSPAPLSAIPQGNKVKSVQIIRRTIREPLRIFSHCTRRTTPSSPSPYQPFLYNPHIPVPYSVLFTMRKQIRGIIIRKLRRRNDEKALPETLIIQ